MCTMQSKYIYEEQRFRHQEDKAQCVLMLFGWASQGATKNEQIQGTRSPSFVPRNSN